MLEPPDDLAGAHANLLAAMRQVENYTDAFMRRAASAETEERDKLSDEFFGPPLTEIEEQTIAACSELQQAAYAEAISVTLNCEGEANPQEALDELLRAAPGEPTCEAMACLCEEGSCPDEIRVTLNGIPGRLTKVPPLPANLTAVSVYIEFDSNDSDVFTGEIKLPLPVAQTREEPLAFYSYVDGHWQRQADVSLTHDDQVANATFASLPPNLVVLRETD